jgi:hypothetical protein
MHQIQPLASFPEMDASLAGANRVLVGYRYIVADNYQLIYKVVVNEIYMVQGYERSQNYFDGFLIAIGISVVNHTSSSLHR